MRQLSTDEFAALIEQLPPLTSSIAVAVSGGPDSMALSYCLKRWAETNGTTLRAFIVDHALRPESAHEAKTTLDQLTKLQIPTEILTWQHAAVTSRIHVTARKARYELLLGACQKHGISDLFLAHQQEDQAETILMRLAKGSGIDGLAGISALTYSDGIRLLRPLLSVPKERLIATCTDAKIPFITDPSNDAGKYARGRLRRVLPLLEPEGLTVSRLIDLGNRAAEASDALNHYTNILLQTAAQQDIAGTIRLNLQALREVPRAVAGRALIHALQSIHREPYAPEHLSLSSLLDAVLSETEMSPRTLHGCLVSTSPTQLILMRELSAITDDVTLRPGETIIWDERWQVSLSPEAQEPYQIRPLGNPPKDVLDKLNPDLRKKIPQGRARATLPALWKGAELKGVPALQPDSSNIAQAQILQPLSIRQ